MRLCTESPETAAQIEQVVRGMIAAASLAKDKSPELAAILKGASVASDGSSVSAKLSCPVAQACSLIKDQAAKARAKGKEGDAPAKEQDAASGRN